MISDPLMSSASASGVDMLLSLFSAFAVGLAVVVTVVTIVLPFAIGFFERRDTH
jgi:hypothetical protein